MQLSDLLPDSFGVRTSSLHLRWPLSGHTLCLRQIEYKQQRVFNAAKLVVCQVSDSLAERACVDGANHLAENLGGLISDDNLRMEAGCEG